MKRTPPVRTEVMATFVNAASETGKIEAKVGDSLRAALLANGCSKMRVNINH